MPTFFSLTSGLSVALSFVILVSADTCGQVSQAKPLYRMYSSEQTDHFYMSDKAEADSSEGRFAAEGIAGLVFPGPIPGGKPITRLLSIQAQDHMMTADPGEVASALGLGYINESEDFADPIYMYSSQICGGIPLFRMYSNDMKDHFYTADAGERDRTIADGGYADEGILGYVLPANAAAVQTQKSETAPTTKPAGAPTDKTADEAPLTNSNTNSNTKAGTSSQIKSTSQTTLLFPGSTGAPTGTGAAGRVHATLHIWSAVLLATGVMFVQCPM